MSGYFIPLIIVLLIVYSIYKKQNAFNSFVSGAKNSFDLILTILPYILAILIMIELYNYSGLNIYITNFLKPITKLVGIPVELTELIIVKNFTGSGSLAILENIFKTYGVDSYIGKCASVIMSSSEATFFVSAVYFSKTKIEKFGKAIPVAIITNIAASICACLICKIL